ncbi:unnamed protein product, partial [Rotaria sp. Silwood2]
MTTMIHASDNFFLFSKHIYIYYLDIHFGFVNSSSIANKTFPLGSTIIYNDDDQILTTGYISSITFQLPASFNINGIYGNTLNFYLLFNNSIITTYYIAPDTTALVQSIDIPSWILTVYPGVYLGIGVLSVLINENTWIYDNTICSTQKGNAYWVQSYYGWVGALQPEWIEQETGVALAFDVVYNPVWNGTTPSTPIPPPITDPPDSANTLDGFLWLFTTELYAQVKGIRNQYAVQPSTTSLLQTFSIPYGELLLCGNEYLAVGTYGYNETSSNKVCLSETGNYFSNVLNNDNSTLFNPTWNGNEYGIAVSYVTQTK